MARFVRATALTLVCLAFAAPAEANFICDFFSHLARQTKRRNCWPQPFACPDRHDARTPFALMVHNGWRLQNTLSDNHFIENTAELAEAGRLKVHWITTEAPQQHRSIYVYRTDDPQLTAARITTIQQLAARLSIDGRMPNVLETTTPARGWSAAEVDSIGRSYRSSAPEPRLPGAGEGS